VRAVAAAHPDERIALWFMDEARVGQKGRLCYRWWLRGRRPPGRCDQRFESAYLFAAVAPATGAEVALVLPEATTAAMNLFLAEFSRNLPAGVHAALVLDGAGWHGARALAGGAGERHARPAAALRAGAQPGRAGLAVPARALPVAAGVHGLPRPRRRLLPSLEPPRRRAGPSPFPL
jgi:hypothetical protein